MNKLFHLVKRFALKEQRSKLNKSSSSLEILNALDMTWTNLELIVREQYKAKSPYISQYRDNIDNFFAICNYIDSDISNISKTLYSRVIGRLLPSLSSSLQAPYKAEISGPFWFILTYASLSNDSRIASSNKHLKDNKPWVVSSTTLETNDPPPREAMVPSVRPSAAWRKSRITEVGDLLLASWQYENRSGSTRLHFLIYRDNNWND